MTRKILDRDILFFGVFVAVFSVYLYLLENFLETNGWWVFLTGMYVLVFITRDISLKNEELRSKLNIKPRKNIRITFWN